MRDEKELMDVSELEMVRMSIRRFVEDELIPIEPLIMESEAKRGAGAGPVIPEDIYERLVNRTRELGLFGIDVPSELGGHELGAMAKMVVTEELNRSIVPFVLPPDSPNLWMLLNACNANQKQKYLIPYAQGKLRSSLALTEPHAGSDAAAIQTSAVPDRDGWLLNGSKLWISGADVADFFIVIAVTDREKRARGGISSFLIDKGTPGLELGKPLMHLGNGWPYEVFLDNCWIPESQLLGELGSAFIPLSNRLGIRRIDIGAKCVGMAQRMLELMVEQAKNRSTFGHPLASRQAVQFWIADTEIEIHAARQLVYDAARKLDAGIDDVRKEASIAKVFSTEMVCRVADRAMQLFGGMGFSKELPIEWIYRNARILRVADGASEILRVQIARFQLGDMTR